MIRLYTWATPNGKKVSIMPEKMGLVHEIHPVNLRGGEPFKPEFRSCAQVTLARWRRYGLWSEANQ
jgi:glutathione S-transferase